MVAALAATMSQTGPVDEPRLTEQELAEAAALDVAIVRRYCQDFAADLESTGRGPDQRWAPICAQTLRLIHQLYQYGQTTEAIRQLFNATGDGSPPPPPATTPPPSTTTAAPEEPPPDPELPWAQWSQRRPEGPWRGVHPPQRPPWWRRWRRR